MEIEVSSKSALSPAEAAVPEKKKKGKKKAAFDVDAALAEALGQDDLPIEDAASRDTPAEEAPSEALPQPSAAPGLPPPLPGENNEEEEYFLFYVYNHSIR